MCIAHHTGQVMIQFEVKIVQSRVNRLFEQFDYEKKNCQNTAKQYIERRFGLYSILFNLFQIEIFNLIQIHSI